jgi:DNA-binding NtrC family response regulator
VLMSTQGNMSEAARRLGITRSTLRSKLEGLGITLERSSKMIDSD